MHFHFADQRLEIPRQTVGGIGEKTHLYGARFVDRGHIYFRRLDPPGLAVEAGDLAEHVVDRHQGETEAEHRDGERREAHRAAAVSALPVDRGCVAHLRTG